MRSTWLCFLIMLVVSSKTWGYLGGPSRYLTEKTVHASHYIVIGRGIQPLPEKTIRQATLAFDAETLVGNWNAYEVHIEHVIQGELADKTIVLELFEPIKFKPFLPVVFQKVIPDHRYLMFLEERQPHGSYRLTAMDGALFQLSDRPQSSQSAKDTLIAEIIATWQDEDPKTAIPLFYALTPLKIPYEQVEIALRRLTSSGNLQISNFAFATRLRYGDTDALTEIVQLTRQFPERDFGEVINVLWRWQDQKGLPAIIELSQSPQIELKRNAIYVLREIGDSTVIPVLAKLMLDDDIEVSYQAVMGLARITKISHEGQESLAPAYAEFPKYRERIIQLWRQKLNTLEHESSK